ncbi:RDD family protein [Bacillus sp. SL00103]
MMMDDDSYYYSTTVMTDEDWAVIMGLIFFYIGAILVGIVVTWLYYAIMESSKLQGTLGKMALGIKVTRVTGEKVTFGRATGRFFAKAFVSNLYILATSLPSSQRKTSTSRFNRKYHCCEE